MSTLKTIRVTLTFHEDSTNQERDNDFAYLYTQLDELIKETSALSHYQILTDQEPESSSSKVGCDQGCNTLPANTGDSQ